MKTMLLIAALACLTGCQRAEPPAIAETLQTGSDQPAIATNAAGNLSSEALSPQDVDFVRTALSEGMGEVELATAVRSQSRNPDVRRLAGDVVDDFNRIDAELANVADARSLSLSNGVAPQLEDAKENVLSDGRDLDEGYLNALIRSYGDLLARYSTAARSASDGAVKSIAGHAQPILQQHRIRAEAIRRNLAAANS